MSSATEAEASEAGGHAQWHHCTMHRVPSQDGSPGDRLDGKAESSAKQEAFWGRPGSGRQDQDLGTVGSRMEGFGAISGCDPESRLWGLFPTLIP